MADGQIIKDYAYYDTRDGEAEADLLRETRTFALTNPSAVAIAVRLYSVLETFTAFDYDVGAASCAMNAAYAYCYATGAQREADSYYSPAMECACGLALLDAADVLLKTWRAATRREQKVDLKRAQAMHIVLICVAYGLKEARQEVAQGLKVA